MVGSATASSSSGAIVHHSCSRCDMISASSPSIRQYAARSGSDVEDIVRDAVEGGVPVDLVPGRIEEGVLLIRAGRRDQVAAHHPDAHALVPPGVKVTCVVQRHLVIRSAQRSHVHMVKTAPAADKYLVQRPPRLA